MSSYTFLTRAVKHRIILLEREVRTLDLQIPYFGKYTGSDQRDRIIYQCTRNIRATLHEMYLKYISIIEQNGKENMSTKKLFRIHQNAIKDFNFQLILQELYERQLSLCMVIEDDLEKLKSDHDSTADSYLKYIFLLFPYSFIYELMYNQKFFIDLFDVILNYDSEKHNEAVVQVFCLIRDFSNRNPSVVEGQHFPSDSPLFFSMAETLVMFFQREQLMKEQTDYLMNFSVYEKCTLIKQLGPESETCELDKNILKRVMEYQAINNGEGSYEKRTFKCDEDFENEKEFVPIPSLQHIVYEIRRMQYQTSPSEMLCLLSSALQMLMTVITADGRGAGADEIFQFFVFLTATASIPNLPTIIHFASQFMDAELRETRFPFVISQLKIAGEFIDARMLPVQPFFLFPFEVPPPRLKGVLVHKRAIKLPGFKILSFPTWRPEYNDLFPALTYYTGANRKAVLHQFELTSVEGAAALFPRDAPSFDNVATLHGSFFQPPSWFVAKHKLITVEGGDFEAARSEVELMSAAVVMGRPVTPLKLSSLKALLVEVSKEWQMHAGFGVDIRTVVAHMQRALVVLGLIPSDSAIDGILGVETAAAIQSFARQRGLLTLTRAIYEKLMKAEQNAVDDMH